MPQLGKVPGVVIQHIPAATGTFVGSPSIVVWTNGDYIASHDLFGPKSNEHQSAVTKIFRSGDRGKSWSEIATLDGQFWSNLFVHRGALYLLGTGSHYGHAVIRRSTDGGRTWTIPLDATTGLLTSDRQYHCAPMPVIVHEGRLWRSMERRDPPTGWAANFGAGMMSAPIEGDLLNAETWIWSNFLPGKANWLNGNFKGWLEGNAVVTREGKIVNILRVDVPAGHPEVAAIMNVSADGKNSSFNPEQGFTQFPGGAKKFTIRHDPKGGLYWSLVTPAMERHSGPAPAKVRNALALASSPDLIHWTTRTILLYHPDTAKHGFQYVDWQFEGEDIIAACRTAYEDGQGGARNNHDANYLTFHRIKGFRHLTEKDSVPLQTKREETRDFIITGWNYEMAGLDDGERAFSNRNYIWREIPASFKGGRITRTAGGVRADIRVQAKRSTKLYVATGTPQRGVNLDGWLELEETFYYTDATRTRMTVFSREVKEGEKVVLPQGNWTGVVLLVKE